MITIREASKHELDFIREQRLRAYEEHASNIPVAHFEALKQAISSDADVDAGSQLIIAELNGEIIGSVVLCPGNTDAYKGLVGMSEFPEIRMLAVSQNARKHGVATKLISECIHRSKQDGAAYIGLHTADFMQGAMRLYERLGFERMPQLDFEPADDGIIVKAFHLRIL